MKEWRESKKKRRKNKESNGNYSAVDFIFDIVFWIPELILIPFRILILLLRGIGRLIKNIFEAI